MPDDNYRIPPLPTRRLEELLPNVINPPKQPAPIEVAEDVARRSWRAAGPILGVLLVIAALSRPDPYERVALAMAGGALVRR